MNDLAMKVIHVLYVHVTWILKCPHIVKIHVRTCIHKPYFTATVIRYALIFNTH